MKRPIPLLTALALALSLPAQRDEQRTTLHFAVDDHRLDDRALAEIGRFLALNHRSEEHEYTLLGHTDSDGPPGYNAVLARHRARSVRERLIALGVDPARITTRAFGERMPLTDNVSAEDKRLNRRVELVFARQRPGCVEDINTLLAPDRTTRHAIDPTRDQWVHGRRGSGVRFPANVLRHADGRPVRGPVEVVLTEALDIEAMIAEGLSTRSGGRVLETGGMLRVEARDAAGSVLVVDSSSSLLVSIPAAAREPGMTLFTSDDGGDWTNTGRPPLARWELPERPAYRVPVFTAPKYKPDLSGKPPLPAEPARPRDPVPPRRESYATTVAWYQFLGRGRIAARDRERYEAAAGVYAGKVAAHGERMRRYQEDCRTWPERYVRYKEAFAQWQSDTACAREDFLLLHWQGSEAEFQRRLAGSRASYEERMAVWRAACEERLAAYGRYLDSLGLSGTGDLGAYVFAASTMGWINCDRFYDVPASERHDFVLHDDDPADKQVYLVFTRINSLMRLRKEEGGMYRQRDIPRGEPATLVAYKVENGTVYLSRDPIVPGRRPSLDFKPASVAEVRGTIQGLRPG